MGSLRSWSSVSTSTIKKRGEKAEPLSSYLNDLSVCATCSSIFSTRASNKGIEATATFDELTASAEAGCQECYLLRELSSLFSANEFYDDLPDDWSDFETPGTVRILKRVPWSEAEKNHDIYNLYCGLVKDLPLHLYSVPEQTPQPPDWPNLPRHSHLCGDTSSDLALSITQNWLQKCHQSHRYCGPQKNTFLPKRTVFVGTSNDQIKLSENNGTSDLYICLSHCWGVSNPLQRISESVGAHKKEIPWSALPKTFQDAIHFTRRLGIRHIWIDSLCIIQDNNEDWATESAKMAAIYASGYLTIAATASSNAEQGLFRTQNHQKEPQRFIIPHSTGQSTSIFAIAAVHDCYLPLLHRGWVLQERYLSPRVLNFTEHELAWHCTGETICECGDANPFGDEAEMPERNSWGDIVEKYSRLALSNTSDKLPALSGIATTLQSEQPELGVYHAGLWDRFFVQQLTWSVWDPKRSLKEYWCPSWSWASVDGQVGFHDEMANYSNVQFAAEVLDVKCVPSTANPFGEALSGYLVLRTALVLACVPSLDFRSGRRNEHRRQSYNNTDNNMMLPLIVTSPEYDCEDIPEH